MHYRCRVNYPRISFKQLSFYLKYMIVPLTWCSAHYTCRDVYVYIYMVFSFADFRRKLNSKKKSPIRKSAGKTAGHSRLAWLPPSFASTLLIVCVYLERLTKAILSSFQRYYFSFFARVWMAVASLVPINIRRSCLFPLYKKRRVSAV